jgi:hypothetical protein
MAIHSTLRFACLAAVLVAGVAGMACSAKPGGPKGGANAAPLGTPTKHPVKGIPSVLYPGSVPNGPPSAG